MRFGRATRKILTTLFIAMLVIFSPVIMFIPALALAEGNCESKRTEFETVENRINDRNSLYSNEI